MVAAERRPGSSRCPESRAPSLARRGPRGATAVSTFALQPRRSPTPQNRPEGYLPIPPAGSYRHGLPAPRGGGRRRGAPGGGGRLRGGPVPSLCARSVVRSTTRRALPADDDRRGPSRSWSSEVPYRKRRSGRRHDRRECGLPIEGPRKQSRTRKSQAGGYPWVKGQHRQARRSFA